MQLLKLHPKSMDNKVALDRTASGIEALPDWPIGIIEDKARRPSKHAANGAGEEVVPLQSDGSLP